MMSLVSVTGEPSWTRGNREKPAVSGESAVLLSVSWNVEPPHKWNCGTKRLRSCRWAEQRFRLLLNMENTSRLFLETRRSGFERGRERIRVWEKNPRLKNDKKTTDDHKRRCCQERCSSRYLLLKSVPVYCLDERWNEISTRGITM